MVIVYSVEEPRTIEKSYKRKLHRRKVHYITNDGKQRTRDVVVDSEGHIKNKKFEKREGVNSADDAKDYLKQHKPRPRVARAVFGPMRPPPAAAQPAPAQRRRKKRHSKKKKSKN